MSYKLQQRGFKDCTFVVKSACVIIVSQEGGNVEMQCSGETCEPQA